MANVNAAVTLAVLPEPNCLFYGHRLVDLGDRFVLVDSYGNQCALIQHAFSPCQLELHGGIESVDWRRCPLAKGLRAR